MRSQLSLLSNFAQFESLEPQPILALTADNLNYFFHVIGLFLIDNDFAINLLNKPIIFIGFLNDIERSFAKLFVVPRYSSQGRSRHIRCMYGHLP